MFKGSGGGMSLDFENQEGAEMRVGEASRCSPWEAFNVVWPCSGRLPSHKSHGIT